MFCRFQIQWLFKGLDQLYTLIIICFQNYLLFLNLFLITLQLVYLKKALHNQGFCHNSRPVRQPAEELERPSADGREDFNFTIMPKSGKSTVMQSLLEAKQIIP